MLRFTLYVSTWEIQSVSVYKHSLFYKYTVQSSLYPDVTVLDGKQIDSYSSRDSIRTPKQDWLKKLPERDQQTGTTNLEEYGIWLNSALYLISSLMTGSRNSGRPQLSRSSTQQTCGIM
uniref:MHC class I-like antigen recognition-like domain-containing protein n=1 Tax=Electrophorus electricus TaxID=8005 RepID=A0AAY5F3C8_ELEEL